MMNYFSTWLEGEEEDTLPRTHRREPSANLDPEWETPDQVVLEQARRQHHCAVHHERYSTRRPGRSAFYSSDEEEEGDYPMTREASIEVSHASSSTESLSVDDVYAEEDESFDTFVVRVPSGNFENAVEESNKTRRDEHQQSSSSRKLNAKAVAPVEESTMEPVSDVEYESDELQPRILLKDFSWMAFGHARTWSAIGFTIAGLILAILCKRSLEFVHLREPLYVSPHLNTVTSVGMVRLELCVNDTHVQERRHLTGVSMPYLNAPLEMTNEPTFFEGMDTSDPCHTIRLSTAIIEDTMWDVSRISTSLAIALGSFLLLMLFLSIGWESINLKPIAIGMLVTYLCQTFSFFFYDSQLCREHSCRVASGTILSILASLCWFMSAMVVILMDVFYTRKQRRLAKEERRRLRRLKRDLRKKLQRESSQATTISNSSRGSDEEEEEGKVRATSTTDSGNEETLWHV